MKEADRLGARFAALLGEDELAGGSVTLRDMKTGDQQTVPRSEAPARIMKDAAPAEPPPLPGGESRA